MSDNQPKRGIRVHFFQPLEGGLYTSACELFTDLHAPVDRLLRSRFSGITHTGSFLPGEVTCSHCADRMRPEAE